MASDAVVRIWGSAEFDVADRRTMVDGVGALTVMPETSADSSFLRLIKRLNEKRTSAEVSGVPSANLTSLRSVNLNNFASGDSVKDDANDGTTLPLAARSSSVSYIALTTICWVG